MANVMRLFLTVLFVVGLHGLLCVTSRVDHVCPRDMGMVRRFLVMSGLVVLCCFTVMMGSVGKMFLHLLVVLGSLFRHCRFLPVLFPHFLQPNVLGVAITIPRS